MQNFQRILAAYRRVDQALADGILAATRSGDDKRRTRLEFDQSLNNHAYFVLLFGQFEVAVDQCCREAIRKRRQSPDWARRRAWDIYNPEDRRLSGLQFEDRVALLCDRQAAIYRQVMNYYIIRNRAAHGELHTRELDIHASAADLMMLYGQLAS